MSPPKTPPTDDLRAGDNLKRIDDLETFRQGLEGKEFDKKVLLSIQESHSIREELKKVGWILLKEKILWIVIGASSFVILGLLKELLMKLITKI